MMTHSERDQRILELMNIEQAHPDAVKHERSMLEYAEKKLASAIDATAGIAALWAAFIPVLDEARRAGLVTESLHHAIAKHQAATYDASAVPALQLQVEESHNALLAALVRVEAAQLTETTQKG